MMMKLTVALTIFLTLSFLVYLSVFPLNLLHFSFIFFQHFPNFPSIFPSVCAFLNASFLSLSFIARLNNLKSLHAPQERAGAHGPAEEEGRGRREQIMKNNGIEKKIRGRTRGRKTCDFKKKASGIK